MSSEIVNTKKPKKLWVKILLIVLLILVIFASYTGYRVWAFLNRLNNEEIIIEEKPLENETMNALLIGVDERGSRSDTLMFASYNPTTGKALVMSIPRDTLAYIPGYWKNNGEPYGVKKINAAHAYRGIPLAIETVERLLNTSIHYYARVNYNVLHKLVDAIGGVPIDIEREMVWNDYAGNLHINFKPGHYVLNGQKAEEYLRWRKSKTYNGGDIERVKRQQKFMKSALNQVLKLNTVFNIGLIEDIIAEGVRTNVTAPFMFKMFKDIMLNFNIQEDLSIMTMPGTIVNGNYEILEENREALDTLLQKHLAPDLTQDLKIRVLNGTAVINLASDVAEKLNTYPNVKATAGNYDHKNVNVTQVISYTEDNIAKYIASLVNAEFNISKGENEGVNEDIVIVLGKDYVKK